MKIALFPWCVSLSILASCTGEVISLRLVMGVSEDQAPEFQTLEKVTVTLVGPGGTRAARDFRRPLPRAIGGFPNESPVDILLEGKQGTSVLFYGERRGIALRGPEEVTVPVPVRKLGDFARTLGPAQVARRHHTATLLADGRVLIAGGEDPDTGVALASAEIFDPATATFSATGSLREARAEHAAVLLLQSQKVVIAGGLAAGDGGLAYRLTIEIYDPARGEFEVAGAISVGRAALTASRYVKDGVERVLFAGGRGLAGPQGNAEIYDPQARTTSAALSLNAARSGHAAVEVPGGILLVGGTSATASGEVFQVANDQFVPTAGPMEASRPRAFAAASGGRILIVGSGALVESYDPARRRFARVATLPASRSFSGIAPLPRDRFLIAGGGEPGAPVRDSYIVEGSGVSPAPWPLDVARLGHALTVLNDATVLVTGGTSERLAEVYLDAR